LKQGKDIAKVHCDKSEEVLFSIDGDAVIGKAAVGTEHGQIRVADLSSCRMISKLNGHAGKPVTQVRVDWEANQLVSCSWDRAVNIFDLRRGKCTHQLSGHGFICHRMEVDFSKQMALSCALEERLCLWDIKHGRLIRSFDNPAGHSPSDICVDWQGMRAAIGDKRGFVKFWDLNRAEMFLSIDGQYETVDEDWHRTAIEALDVDWDQGLLLTGNTSGQLQLIDVATGQRRKLFRKARRCLTQCWLGRGTGNAPFSE